MIIIVGMKKNIFTFQHSDLCLVQQACFE